MLRNALRRQFLDDLRLGSRVELPAQDAIQLLFFQSGKIESRDALDGFDELPPTLLLGREHLSSLGGYPVVSPSTLSRLFNPFALDPTASFESVEHGIKRGDLKTQRPLGTAFDQLRDLVAMTCAGLYQGENEQLGKAFFEFAILLFHMS